MFYRGLLIIVSGPSGTGKGTILKGLREKNPNIKISISATTRDSRVGEVNGENYFFKNVNEFETMIKENELLEWVNYCGNFYGTPRKNIEDLTSKGIDVILEIEVEGALNVKSKYPSCVLIFVLPPSYKELRKRIEGRATEDDSIITRRLEKANNEVKNIGKYDYFVINQNIEQAADEINSIVTAERLKISRYNNVL